MRNPTKKERILALFMSGMTNLDEIARHVQTTSSYAASVLQAEGLISGYFDLYTTSSHPMNVYSSLFRGKLGFRDTEIARRSVEFLEECYREFSHRSDRGGQHHALVMALTMYDRARWTEKFPEAAVFRNWLVEKLLSDESLAPEIPFQHAG